MSIGTKPWAQVTAHDVERIRDDLDAAIVARREHGPGRRRLLPRTAYDVWFALTAAIRAARSSKRRDLRALEGRPSPAVDVEPPGDRGNRRARRKTFLYPVEVARLLACRDVPRAWRELYTIAAYLYLRPGELIASRGSRWAVSR